MVVFARRYTVADNATYVTVTFYDSDGIAYNISGLSGSERTSLTFTVPNCTYTDACTRANTIAQGQACAH